MPRVHKYHARHGHVKPIYRVHKMKPAMRFGKPAKRLRSLRKSILRLHKAITTGSDDPNLTLNRATDTKAAFMNIMQTQSHEIAAHLPHATGSVRAWENTSQSRLDRLFQGQVCQDADISNTDDWIQLFTVRLMKNAGTTAMEPRDVSFALAVMGGIQRGF